MKSFLTVLLAATFLVGCGADNSSDAPEASAAVDPAATSEAAPTEAPTVAVVADGTPIKVYKPTYCGCCSGWVEHMQAAGFEVEVEEMTDPTAIKTELGVPDGLESCHSAVVDGYVIEGHVPADVVARLLRERPDIKGIAVPGMPVGTPGMETISGRYDPYDVIAFDDSGQMEVFETRR